MWYRRARARGGDDAATVVALVECACANGVPVTLRDDGALEVPGEAVTDPVVFDPPDGRPLERILLNVAAIRSTGLSASLGIGGHVIGLLAERGVALEPERDLPVRPVPNADAPWWRRTALHQARLV